MALSKKSVVRPRAYLARSTAWGPLGQTRSAPVSSRENRLTPKGFPGIITSQLQSKTTMKRIASLAALAALIVLNLSRAQAQTNTGAPAFRTNVLLNVAISLTAYIENVTPIQTNLVVRTARPSKIGTKDIINALGTQLGQGTNMLSGAKLLLRTTDLGTTNQASAFVLRSGTNDTDVSSYLRFNFPSNHRTVTTERFNP